MSISASQGKVEPARNGKVDLLKFIFSMAVAVYHFGNSVDSPDKLFTKGYFAVEFFFITSGYLFAKSLSQYTVNNNSDVFKVSLSFMKKKYSSFLTYHLMLYLGTLICLANYYKLNFNVILVKLFDSIPDLLLLQILSAKPLQWLGHEWYLSAMLAAMFIITPILLRYRKAFLTYIAPILSTFLLLFLFNKHGHLNTVREWDGVAYSGLIRALAEISLGCLCYAIHESKVIDKINNIALRITEVLIYTVIIMYMTGAIEKPLGYTLSSLDFSLVYLLAAAVILSFSDKTSIRFLNNKFIYFLGKLSLPIYLCHLAVRSYIIRAKLEVEYYPYLGVFLLTVLIVSLIFMYLGDGIGLLVKKLRAKEK